MKKTLEQLVQLEEIEDSPFCIVTIENKSFIGLTGNRVSEMFDTKEQAKEWFIKNQWRMITSLIVSILEKRKEFGL